MRRFLLVAFVGLLVLPLRSFTESPDEDAEGARFGELVFDSAIDENGDGYYEFLEFGFKVNIPEPHPRFYCGVLKSEDGKEVISSGSFAFSAKNACASVDDSASGMLTLRLRFSGYDILESGCDGRYRLELGIKKVGGREPEDTAMYQATNSYDFSRFREIHIAPDGPMKDQGVDSDSDGKYEYLEVSFVVREYVSAGYQIVGRVKAPDSSLIAVAEDTLADSQRVWRRGVALRFDGREILESGEDGPYELEVTLLRAGKVISTKRFKTSEYTHTNFEASE